MGHGCHECGSPNSCECEPYLTGRKLVELEAKQAKAKVKGFKGKGPDHYKRLDPQPAEVIRKWKLDWPKASALKYIARAGYKGTKEDELKDIQKAIDFLQLELEWLTT